MVGAPVVLAFWGGWNLAFGRSALPAVRRRAGGRCDPLRFERSLLVL